MSILLTQKPASCVLIHLGVTLGDQLLMLSTTVKMSAGVDTGYLRGRRVKKIQKGKST